jgi:hypothetical protein
MGKAITLHIFGRELANSLIKLGCELLEYIVSVSVIANMSAELCTYVCTEDQS